MDRVIKLLEAKRSKLERDWKKLKTEKGRFNNKRLRQDITDAISLLYRDDENNDCNHHNGCGITNVSPTNKP